MASIDLGSKDTAAQRRAHGSYREILASTLLIGGSTALNVAVGILRTKAMALMLGPAGFGLMALFTSIADMARSVAEMGINSSGVRQIAESVASGDAARVARTVRSLRRIALVLGIVGAAGLALAAVPVARVSFGDASQAGAVALLGLAVCFRLVADAQAALLQGMRRVADLAWVGIAGALLGTAASLPIVWWLGRDGIVPALVATAALSASACWWRTRRVRVDAVPLTRTVFAGEALALLKLGLAFMASGLLMTLAAYVVRIVVLRHDGAAGAGFYQAAWTLGGLYVGFILQAMGADFYPRLVGAVESPREANRLVNEQVHVSLLLAGPGVIATLMLAPWVVWAFYSSEFAAAVDVLRWICLGMALRVITWPMGYIVVAKNRQVIFVAAEAAWTAVNIGLSWLGVQAFGTVGAGMAFFGSYVFHGVMVWALARHLTGFAWTAANRRLGAGFLLSIGTVFAASTLLPAPAAVVLGGVVLLLNCIHTVRGLLAIVGGEQLPPKVRRLLAALRPRSAT